MIKTKWRDFVDDVKVGKLIYHPKNFRKHFKQINSKLGTSKG